MASAVLLANLAATLVLAGLIWTVQLVHYPLFAHVGAGSWRAYHAAHVRSVTPLVAVLMTVELVGAFALPFVPPGGVPAGVAWAAAVPAVLTWVVTAVVHVPQHRALAARPDPAAVRALVRWNWLRTGLWTARSALLLALVATLL